MTRDELCRLLKEAAPLAGWDDDSLNAAAVLSSLDVILISVRLFDLYGIRIPSREMKRGNFLSIDAVWQLCKRIQGGMTT